MKKYFCLFLLLALFAAIMPGVSAAKEKQDIFLNTVLAPGFHWKMTPEDLEGSRKTRRYPVDPSIDQWEYVYDASAGYIFNPDFLGLFTEDDRIDVEFAFIHDQFSAVHLKITTANPDTVDACRTYFSKKLGATVTDGIMQRNSVYWEKENYDLRYTFDAPNAFHKMTTITVGIYIKPTAEEIKKSQAASDSFYHKK
jgi:hypothetical protein